MAGITFLSFFSMVFVIFDSADYFGGVFSWFREELISEIVLSSIAAVTVADDWAGGASLASEVSFGAEASLFLSGFWKAFTTSGFSVN